MAESPAPDRTLHLGVRIAATLAGGSFFLLAVPLAAAWVARELETRWLMGLVRHPVSVALGATLSMAGLACVGWTAATQIGPGRGTPVPWLPPQKLLTDGPFALCRNPMWFGALLYYLGLAIMWGLVWALIVALLLMLRVALYHRFIEESELEARYGQSYLDYKARTPFVLPRIRRSQRGAGTDQ